jgi:hypothetical protein
MVAYHTEGNYFRGFSSERKTSAPGLLIHYESLLTESKKQLEERMKRITKTAGSAIEKLLKSVGDNRAKIVGLKFTDVPRQWQRLFFHNVVFQEKLYYNCNTN